MDDETDSNSGKQGNQTSKEDYVRQRQNFMQRMLEADGKHRREYIIYVVFSLFATYWAGQKKAWESKSY